MLLIAVVRLYSNNYMNTSSAFSDYMVSYSVNRSINLSPTMGRLHKNRQSSSFGPTICLLNRSRQKIEESTAIEQKDEHLFSKVLMLSLQIERLSEQNRRLKGEREEWSSGERVREAGGLRQQNDRLRASVERAEGLRQEQQRRLADQIYELKEKVSVCEAQNRTLVRRLKDNQREMEELQLKGRINQSVAERAKMQASRMEMSMQFNSTNIDLHKSIAREKNVEIEGWRERVTRCEEIIRDQKFIITGQKQELAKERGRAGELEGRYRTELEFVRRQLEASQQEHAQIGQAEVDKLQAQIRDWQARVVKSENQLRDKCLIIANQVKTITEQEQRCLELDRKLQDQEFSSHSRVVRAEEAAKLAHKERERECKKLTKELHRYIEEVQTLKLAIEQYRQNIAEKDFQVQQTAMQLGVRLRQKQQQVKRLRVRGKEQQSETKMSKSLSLDNMVLSNKLRASQVSLQHIVTSVAQLKNSHDRSSRLLERSMNAKESYYVK